MAVTSRTSERGRRRRRLQVGGAAIWLALGAFYAAGLLIAGWAAMPHELAFGILFAAACFRAGISILKPLSRRRLAAEAIASLVLALVAVLWSVFVSGRGVGVGELVTLSLMALASTMTGIASTTGYVVGGGDEPRAGR